MYHLCGDNLDKNVKSRYFRVNKHPNTASKHYFHYYAFADRIDFSRMAEEPIACRQTDVTQVALSLLPTSEDDKALRSNVCVLISRILCRNLTYFKHTFDNTVEWHIKHDYYKEMSKASEWVRKLHACMLILVKLLCTSLHYRLVTQHSVREGWPRPTRVKLARFFVLTMQ